MPSPETKAGSSPHGELVTAHRPPGAGHPKDQVRPRPPNVGWDRMFEPWLLGCFGLKSDATKPKGPHWALIIDPCVLQCFGITRDMLESKSDTHVEPPADLTAQQTVEDKQPPPPVEAVDEQECATDDAETATATLTRNAGDEVDHRGVGRRALEEEIRLYMDDTDLIKSGCGVMHALCRVIRRSDMYIRDFVPFIWNNAFGCLIQTGLGIVRPMTYSSSLQTLLDVDGAAGKLLCRESERRAFKLKAKDLLSDIVRDSTTTHNDDKALPAKSAFLKAARRWRPPTDAEISAAATKHKNGSDHPYAATARHQTVVSIRKMIDKLGLRQWDPNISSYVRDQGANVHGTRPVHTLKDLYHNDPREELLPGDVITRMDCCNYEKDLKSCSGHHFVLWASKYPALSGRCEDSVYYYDSPTTVTEIVGHGDGARYRNQIPWKFNENDLFYLESECGRRYSVYQVVIYYQPKILKQVVFGVCLHTVNLPYPIHDRMSHWVNGHALDSTGIGTIGPADNVRLCAADPKLPHTRNILVMQTGTVDRPTVSLKYDDDIGPDCSVTITNKLYELIRYIQHSGGRGQTLTEIQQALKLHLANDFGEKIPDPAIAVLANFMRASAEFGPLPNVVYLSNAQLDEPPPREVPSATAVRALPPLTNGTNPGVLAKTPEAMEAYVENRLQANINTTKPTMPFNKTWYVVLGYFIKQVAAESGVEPGSICMPTFQEVEESRNGPLQRARRENWGKNGIVASDDTARVDTKKEVQHKVDDAPRGVTSLPYELGVNSGRLGKGLEKVMKLCKHYNPGDTPLEIAECVRDVYQLGLEHEAATASQPERRVAPDGRTYTKPEFEEFFGRLDEWNETKPRANADMTSGVREKDFSKMDEMHSEFTSDVVRLLIRFFFHPSCIDEALEIYDSLFQMRTKVGEEVINSGWKNSSGSGITTVLNCLVNAVLEMATTIVSLCLLVRDQDDEETLSQIKSGEYELTTRELRRCMTAVQEDERFQGLTTYGSMMEMAYAWIGPKFGDDALDPGTPFVSDSRWAVASEYIQKNIGMVTKLGFVSCALRQPCEYLSRVYPDPTRTLVSYCKIEKAVDKLSFSQADDVEKYALKLMGYGVTDINTPIVGPLIKAAASVFGVDLARCNSLADNTEYMAKLYDIDRDMYYRLSNGPFPPCEDEMADDTRRVSVARQFGFTGPELNDYDAKLSEMTTRAEIAQMRLPVDPTKVPKADPPNVRRVAAHTGAVELAPRSLGGKGKMRHRSK